MAAGTDGRQLRGLVVNQEEHFASARDDLSEVVNRVVYGEGRIRLICHGKEVACVISGSPREKAMPGGCVL